jgi:hypothetical protein
MDVDQNIFSRKIRYLPACVNWIYLLKSIKDNRNKNTYETGWIK